jgi:hypothetical protein
MVGESGYVPAGTLLHGQRRAHFNHETLLLMGRDEAKEFLRAQNLHNSIKDADYRIALEKYETSGGDVPAEPEHDQDPFHRPALDPLTT